MTWLDQHVDDLAERLGVTPREIRLAIALVRSGNSALITAVADGKMTIAMALQALRTTKERSRAS